MWHLYNQRHFSIMQQALARYVHLEKLSITKLVGNRIENRKVMIHYVFRTRKWRGGRSAIGWQAGPMSCEPIADLPSREFRS